MKFEVLKENLNYALQGVSRVLPSRPVQPILGHILLEATAGELRLLASNLETTIVTRIGAKVEKEGKFTLPGRTFLEIISSLSDEKVSLELVEGSVTVKAGKFSARINGTSHLEYPDVGAESLLNLDFWEIDEEVFLPAVSRTGFCVAQDESRAALTGVLFKDSTDLVLAATDGFRLSVVKILKGIKKGKEEEKDLIIPAKSLLEVTRLLTEKQSQKEKKGKKVLMAVLEKTNQVVFDLGETKIYTRLVAGKFPDYEKIIPANSLFKIVVEAQELLKVVKLAGVFARESANIVRFTIGQAKLKISANAKEIGENESELEIEVTGKLEEEFSIAFNYRYLLDFLASFGGDGEISIDFSGPTAPGVFKIVGEENFLHLIMPVRVQA